MALPSSGIHALIGAMAVLVRGKPLSFSSQIARLVPVRGFFKWLTRQNVLLWNPASEIELPRAEKRLPKHVLSADEAEAVMLVPNVADPIGLRDRAILETLYSTGIRRMEVINLTVFDLDQERGTLMVRQGKGKKDRMVPIGERAIAWLARYLNEARPQLVLPPDPGTLFLTQEGEEISCHRLTQLVREYVLAADIGKSGACHLFRHTCATLMLEGGADIRYIQEMLGHVELSTTQIYTQVSIRKLKAVHTLTHPGAKLERAADVAVENGNGEAGTNGSERAVDAGAGVLVPVGNGNGQNAAANAPTSPDVAAEALFAALDAEADEEARGAP
jgi:integrase/recombinase XerD